MDSLSAFGGGDCREPTFKGVIEAIDKGLPYTVSPMYVFTDAPSKTLGHYTSDEAIGLSLEYIIPINFFFSRYGCSDPSKDSDYKFAVQDTGGTELFFRSPLSFAKTEGLVKADMDGSAIISSGGGRGVTSSPRIEFPVDSSMKRIVVAVSASSNDGLLSLVDPSGNSATSLLRLYKGKLWVIENPANGTWALTAQSNVQDLVYMVNALILQSIAKVRNSLENFMISSSRVDFLLECSFILNCIPHRRREGTCKMFKSACIVHVGGDNCCCIHCPLHTLIMHCGVAIPFSRRPGLGPPYFLLLP